MNRNGNGDTLLQSPRRRRKDMKETKMKSDVRKRNAEEWAGKENCPDCGAKLGEVHRDLCDIEICTVCGGQRLSCGCEHNGDRETWAGELV